MSVGFSSAEFWRVSWRHPGRVEGMESGLHGANSSCKVREARRAQAGGRVGAGHPSPRRRWWAARGPIWKAVWPRWQGWDLPGSRWEVANESQWTRRCLCTQWGSLSLDWRVVSPERQRKQNWLEQSPDSRQRRDGERTVESQLLRGRTVCPANTTHSGLAATRRSPPWIHADVQETDCRRSWSRR